MILLPDVLSPEELAFVQAELAAAKFEDGKLTAQGMAKSVKQNEQLQRDQETATDLDAILMQAITRHTLLVQTGDMVNGCSGTWLTPDIGIRCHGTRKT